MVLLGGVLVVLAVLSAAPGEPERPAPRRAGLSWAEADSLTRKLETIDRRSRTRVPARPESVLVTQGELNSYLNLTYAAEMPPGVDDLEVALENERIHARAHVDLEKVRGQVPAASGWGPLSLLGGSVPVELRARLQSRDGFGSVEVEEVRVATVPVPVSVLEQLVASSTRSARNPEGFDLLAPFRLPYAVKRVRIEPGRAFLDF